MPSIIAVIPAKTTSYRIANKNLRELCGRPLYMYAVDNCVQAGVFEKNYLSSDGVLDTNLKATLHNRALELCGDVPASTVAAEVLHDMYPEPWKMPEWTCLCQPTSPCLRAASLTAAAGLCQEDVDAVIACRAGSGEPCGAFYFMRSYILLRKHVFADTLKVLGESGRLVWYPLPSDEAIDVDCHWDWRLAEMVLKMRNVS